MATKEQLHQRMKEICDKIEADNLFDTFEPHPGEENYSGFEELAHLYESRLIRLFVEQIDGEDEELQHFFLEMIEDQIKRDKYQ
jgi:hypothetical protein